MSINSKKKGNAYELDCLHKWQDIFPEAVTARFGDRSEDAKGHDLINTEQFKVQCKRGRKYRNPNVLEDIEVEEGEVPILMTRADRKKTVVCMYESDFFDLLRSYYEDC